MLSMEKSGLRLNSMVTAQIQVGRHLLQSFASPASISVKQIIILRFGHNFKFPNQPDSSHLQTHCDTKLTKTHT